MQFVIIKILLQKIRVTKYIYLFNPIAYFVVCNVYCEYLLKTK